MARGYSQQKGIDYNEIYTLVMRMKTLRLLLTIVAMLNLNIHQIDVVTVYFTGDLKEEIYIEVSEGLLGNL